MLHGVAIRPLPTRPGGPPGGHNGRKRGTMSAKHRQGEGNKRIDPTTPLHEVKGQSTGGVSPPMLPHRTRRFPHPRMYTCVACGIVWTSQLTHRNKPPVCRLQTEAPQHVGAEVTPPGALGTSQRIRNHPEPKAGVPRQHGKAELEQFNVMLGTLCYTA